MQVIVHNDHKKVLKDMQMAEEKHNAEEVMAQLKLDEEIQKLKRQEQGAHFKEVWIK